MKTAHGTISAILALGLAGACAQEPPEDAAAGASAEPTEGVFGQVAPAVQGNASVVTLTPIAPTAGEAESPDATIDQLGLTFSPRRLIARLGESVTFTNSESMSHNVHLRSVSGDSTIYNEDTEPSGQVAYTFPEAGGYDVLCDTHPGMYAFVFVTAAPYSTFADDDGAFEITDLAPGEYTLEVWSLDPDLRYEQVVTVAQGVRTRIPSPPAG